eukprot:GFYU01000676.1.p2 GENE.GFYU01000676.1~~GFYU01000676.1.p2  ORF type:complete len:200 (-),score=75.99 GFYU01000676.1:244-843(-)
MFTARSKIIKDQGAEPDSFEESVAQALFDLEVNVADLKAELRDLHITAAKEVDIPGGKKAVVIFVPFPQLKDYHKIQARLVAELEKRFSGKHVMLVAQRRILNKTSKNNRTPNKQMRPRSRTLASVHENILEDLVYPTPIVGKRLRVRSDLSRMLKVYLDPKEATGASNVRYKLDTFATVYKKLTGKDVTFEFPVLQQE